MLTLPEISFIISGNRVLEIRSNSNNGGCIVNENIKAGTAGISGILWDKLPLKRIFCIRPLLRCFRSVAQGGRALPQHILHGYDNMQAAWKLDDGEAWDS